MSTVLLFLLRLSLLKRSVPAIKHTQTLCVIQLSHTKKVRRFTQKRDTFLQSNDAMVQFIFVLD